METEILGDNEPDTFSTANDFMRICDKQVINLVLKMNKVVKR